VGTQYRVNVDTHYMVDESAGVKTIAGIEYPKKIDEYSRGAVVDYSDDPERGKELHDAGALLTEEEWAAVVEQQSALAAQGLLGGTTVQQIQGAPPVHAKTAVDNPDTGGHTQAGAAAKAAPAKAVPAPPPDKG
jgi:hypothetical protein